MTCTVGSGLYVEVRNAPDFSAQRLKEEIAALVERDIPLRRRRVATKDAVAYFEQHGQIDKAKLLKWSTADYFDEYSYGEFRDYYYGEMAHAGVGRAGGRGRIPVLIPRQSKS